MAQRRIRRPGRLISDSGMIIPEYTVGCVAACGFGYSLWRLLTSSQVYELLDRLVRDGWLDMRLVVGPWT